MLRLFEDEALRTRLEKLRTESPYASGSSLLRIFDVAVLKEWKFRRLEKRAEK